MKSNNFSNSEKDWNVSLSKNLIVKAKRKASSVFEPDDDNEPLSNVNKNSATFSFSHKDIESSTKAADNLKPNLGIISEQKKSDSLPTPFLLSKAKEKLRF